MRVTSRFLVAAGLAMLFAGTTFAQMMNMRGPSVHGVWNPVIGSGAVYSVEKDGQRSEMEFAVVSKENVEGKDGYWLQITTRGRRGEVQTVMKSLSVLEGPSTTVKRMIMQPAGEQAMEMPMMMMRGNTTYAADVRRDAEDLGSESITTPAGTFACEHYHMKDGSADVWVAKNVPPYGLVKSVGKDSTMILTRVVTDVKDRIVGTPVPFNPMGMMQRQPD